MVKPMKLSEQICEQLTMQDVLARYHHLGRNNRVDCPLHGGTNNNFSYNDKVFHCFTCGESGNAISFVGKLFGLTFQEAICRLDADFRLGLLNSPPSMRSELNFRRKRREAKQRRADRELKNAAYWKVFDEWKRLDDAKRDYRPLQAGQRWHPLYIEALQKLDYTTYILDCLSKNDSR